MRLLISCQASLHGQRAMAMAQGRCGTWTQRRRRGLDGSFPLTWREDDLPPLRLESPSHHRVQRSVNNSFSCQHFSKTLEVLNQQGCCFLYHCKNTQQQCYVFRILRGILMEYCITFSVSFFVSNSRLGFEA